MTQRGLSTKQFYEFSEEKPRRSGLVGQQDVYAHALAVIGVGPKSRRPLTAVLFFLIRNFRSIIGHGHAGQVFFEDRAQK
jgi:hypothetical protein